MRARKCLGTSNPHRPSKNLSLGHNLEVFECIPELNLLPKCRPMKEEVEVPKKIKVYIELES